MTINTTAIKSLLEPVQNAVFGNYPSYPAHWRQIFKTYTSDKAVERDVEMKPLGAAALAAEGASVTYDTMGERYTTSYVNRYVKLGFIITRQAIKDNQYKTQFPMNASALRDAFANTKETLGAAVLNNGYDGTNYPIGDGQALFSTSHPIDGSVVANTPSAQVDLNETSLEAALIAVQAFKDGAGKLVAIKAQKLLVPSALQFVARRLLGSDLRVDSANHDINAIKDGNYLPGGFAVNQFLTDSDQWTILTDSQHGFKYFQREPFETDMYTDFDNDNLKVKGLERYSFGVSNFRSCYGSQGA